MLRGYKKIFYCIVYMGCVLVDLQGAVISSTFQSLWKEKFSYTLKAGVVYDLEENTFLFADNADKNFFSASVQKILTALLAVEILGPQFQYETCLYADGTVHNSLLDGNLLVVGSGDPSMDFYFQGDKGGDKVIEKWIDEVKQKGIQSIRGRVRIDNSAFESNGIGKGWMFEDLLYRFSAPISAFSLNQNCVNIEVKPNAVVQQPPSIRFLEPCEGLKISNSLLTTGEKNKNERLFDFDLESNGSGEIMISGFISKNSDPVVYPIVVPDPNARLLQAFKTFLNSRKVSVFNEPLPSTLKPTLLAKHVSSPLTELLAHMLKYSDNFYAESIFKTLSLKNEGKGTSSASAKIAAKFLEDVIHVPRQNFKVVDGSGLSRYNFMTPRTMCAILQYIYKSGRFELFKKMLTSLKEDKKTLSKLAKIYTDSVPNIWFKTGNMSGIASVAGFLTTKHGKTLAFVFSVNNFNDPTLAVHTFFAELSKEFDK